MTKDKVTPFEMIRESEFLVRYPEGEPYRWLRDLEVAYPWIALRWLDAMEHCHTTCYLYNVAARELKYKKYELYREFQHQADIFDWRKNG